MMHYPPQHYTQTTPPPTNAFYSPVPAPTQQQTAAPPAAHPAQRPLLPHYVNRAGQPSQELFHFINSVDLDDSDQQASQRIATRLARFGITSPSKVARLTPKDMETIFTEYEDDFEAFHLQDKITIHMAMAQQQAQHQPQQPPGTLQAPSQGPLVSAKDIRKALKNKQREDDSSDESEEELFAITAALKAAGLPGWRRQEHIDPSRLSKLADKVKDAHQKNKPYIPSTSAEIGMKWYPRASSAHIDLAPSKHDKCKVKKFINGPQLIRHRLTWGISMIAVGALDYPSLFLYIAELLELAQHHDLDTVEAYDMARMRKIIHEAETINTSDTTKCDIQSAEDAKAWLGARIAEPDPTTMKSILLSNSGIKGFAGKTSKKEKKRSRSRSGDRTRICLYHNPRDNKKCTNEPCTYKHLDTTIEANWTKYCTVWEKVHGSPPPPKKS
jgi:hypothetical protein